MASNISRGCFLMRVTRPATATSSLSHFIQVRLTLQIVRPQPRLSSSAAECDDAFDKLAVHLPDSGENSGEDQHSHENEGQCYLGGYSDTEPDHKERREDHTRDGVENGHQRLEQLRDQGDQGRRDPE